MALYKGTTKLSGVGSGFAPLNQGNNGDVLKKSQFGYEWGEEDVNTKTFVVEFDTRVVDTQPAIDYIAGGKNALLRFGNAIYSLRDISGGVYHFIAIDDYSAGGASYSYITLARIDVTVNNGTVTNVAMGDTGQFINFLATGRDYSTPYTPEYDGSPATKKYVDDIVGDIETLLNNI